jgi:hypothetical protein
MLHSSLLAWQLFNRNTSPHPFTSELMVMFQRVQNWAMEVACMQDSMAVGGTTDHHRQSGHSQL